MSSPNKSSANTSLASSAPDLSIRGDRVAILSTGYTKPASEQISIDKSSGDINAQDDQDSDESAVVSHAARFRQSPWNFFREISLHVSGSEWRSYDNVIGQPIFYSGFSENMKSSVISSSLLQKKIRYLADKKVKSEEAQVSSRQRSDRRDGDEDRLVDKDHRDQAMETKRISIQLSLNKFAEKLIDNMICKMESKTFIRSAYYFATQLLTRAYHQGMI